MPPSLTRIPTSSTRWQAVSVPGRETPANSLKPSAQFRERLDWPDEEPSGTFPGVPPGLLPKWQI